MVALPSSPHLPTANSVGAVMRQVLYALIPGIVVATIFFGWGVLSNLLIAIVAALLIEAAMLKLRGRPIKPFLNDYTAVVTAVLLAIAIPPASAWWLICLGIFFALVFGKHLYGGLGYNPFNPAMIGYVVLLIAFPAEMTRWLPALGSEQAGPDMGQTLMLMAGSTVDGVSGATPLDHLKTALGQALTIGEARAHPLYGVFSGKGWEWLNLAFLAGGIYLIWKRIIRWHIPAGMLGMLAIMSLLFWLGDGSRHASPLFHLTVGGAMLGAFFIATDPVSAATTPRGQLIYGAGIGLLVWIIRSYGGYPDAIAFAVLLMNMTVPFLDRYTQPRVYGYGREPK